MLCDCNMVNLIMCENLFRFSRHSPFLVAATLTYPLYILHMMMLSIILYVTLQLVNINCGIFTGIHGIFSDNYIYQISFYIRGVLLEF